MVSNIYFQTVSDNTLNVLSETVCKRVDLGTAKKHKLIEHFVAGSTAGCMAELIGVNRKTGAYYYHNYER